MYLFILLFSCSFRDTSIMFEHLSDRAVLWQTAASRRSQVFMDFCCLTFVQCVFLALPQECVDMLVRKCSVHVGFIVPLWPSLSLKTRLGDSHHGSPKICTLRSCVWKAQYFLSSSDQKLQCTVSSLSVGMACVCGFEVASSASATATLSATCLK